MFEKVTGRQWGAREREAWRRERRETLVFSCPLLPPVGWGEGDFFFPSIFFSLFLTIFYLFFYFSGMFREGEEMKFQRKPAGKAKKEEVQKRASRSLPPNMLRLYTSPLFFFLFLFHRDVVEGYYYGKSERIPIREIFIHTYIHINIHTYIYIYIHI